MFSNDFKISNKNYLEQVQRGHKTNKDPDKKNNKHTNKSNHNEEQKVKKNTRKKSKDDEGGNIDFFA